MEKKNKVLFVDDEPAVLRSLTREFFDAPFEVFTASGGNDALRILEEEDIDLIVSDVKMPGMNGVEFLEVVKRNHPDVGRMILSGYVETDLVTRGMITGAILDYYPKPWNTESLQDEILNYLSVREHLQNEELLKVIHQISQLPVLPEIYQQFVEAIKNDAPVSKIASIIEQDAAITAKLLQLANSAFYAGGRPTESVQQAIVRLGLNLVKEMILTIGIFEQFSLSPAQQHWLDEINSHSNRVNKIFQIMYQELYQKRLNTSLGLLHDIGQVIMAVYFSETYQNYINVMNQNHYGDFFEVEKKEQVFPVNHTELGGYFLSLWNMPILMVQAAMFHHTPDKVSGTNEEVITILHLADSIGKNPDYIRTPECREKMELFGMEAPDALIELIEKEIVG